MANNKGYIKSISSSACILTFVCIANLVNAQRHSNSNNVTDITLDNVSNYVADELKLSKFRGKLIILDFWGFNCTSCLKALPELDSLQNKFNDELQIILVNREDKKKTEEFFKKRKRLTKPSVPLVTTDTILNKLFPHSGEPFHVWIDKNGKVLYRAEGFYATSENIQKVISGIDISLPSAMKNVYTESFFDKRWRELIEYYSYFSKCKPEIHLEAPSEVKGFSFLTFNCAPVGRLYSFAYDGLTGEKYNFSGPGRTILELSDSNKYRSPKSGEQFLKWLEIGTYNYQLFLPIYKKEDRFKIMANDLANYFGFDVNIQKRKVKCLVLIRTNDERKLATEGGTPIDNFIQFDVRNPGDSIRLYLNKPFATFFHRLRSYLENEYETPVIDSTSYVGNIDIKMNGETLDLLIKSDLIDELRKYGLDIVEKDVLLDVLVISDKVKLITTHR